MAVNKSAGPQAYELIVAGELGGDWYDWPEGFEVVAGRGVTAIRGTMVDQSALYGTIARLESLGLTLLSVNRKDTALETWGGRR